MPISVENDLLGQTVRISGTATIYEAAELRDALRRAMGTGGPLSVDLEHVTACDLTLPQLLVAAHRSATELGVGVTCTAMSRAVRDTLDAAGLAVEDVFGPPMEVAV